MKTLVVGIAGTAKNTGKTTALSALLAEIRQRPEAPLPALTSIGYDGESFDNVTGLPKPRIEVAEGELLAVAERCLFSGSAALEVIETTDIQTPLGKIALGRVTRPGKIVLAGPNNRRDLARIISLFEEQNVPLAIVDGALSRIAPLVLAQALLLCTGAARHSDLDLLTEETKLVVDLLKTPVLEERGRVLEPPSVLNQSGFDNFIAAVTNADTIRLEGIFSQQYYPALAGQAKLLSGKRLIFSDSIKLMLSGEAARTCGLLKRLRENGAEVGLARPSNLAAITVNPYYPKYRYDLKEYEATYVDRDELLRRLSGCVEPVPCFDVVRQGGAPLYEALFNPSLFLFPANSCGRH